MFSVEMLPARYGDSLLVEYGSRERPKRILIDGGTAPTIEALTARIERIPAAQRRFVLLIVTHIDVDHIGGVLNLLAERSLGVTFDDVWFNGWRHLPDVEKSDRLGPIDGEILTILLDAPDSAGQPYRWNRAFGGASVAVPSDGRPPTIVLPGGMSLTVLSPGRDELLRLKGAWTTIIRNQGWSEDQVRRVARAAAKRKGVRLDEPGAGAVVASTAGTDEPLGTANPIERWAAEPFTCDTAPANGSTIAVLAEYRKKSVLLTGDSYPTVLQRSIDTLLKQRGSEKLQLDAYKLAHHGSRGNTSATLLERLACRNYLVSTNGAKFHHPDPPAIARAIARGGRGSLLHFNYVSEETQLWDNPIWKRDYDYAVRYPPEHGGGLSFSIDSTKGRE